MHDYKPEFPFNVAAHFLKATTKKVKGVTVKEYEAPTKENQIFCSFKTYGGTEQNSNGVRIVLDTANIETWFRPDITANCGFCLAENPGKIYEIEGAPENINMANQFLKFKVQAVKGGA